MRRRRTAILSMGLAGALAPTLKPGDWVVGTIAPTGMQRREWSVGAGADRQRGRTAAAATGGRALGERGGGWIERLARAAARRGGRPHPCRRPMIVAAAQEGARCRSRRARSPSTWRAMSPRASPQRHGLPFAVARVISDARRPTRCRAPCRSRWRRTAGSGSARCCSRSSRRPWQIPALIGVGLDAGRAMKRLARGYDVLARAGFALGDQGQLPLDMA